MISICIIGQTAIFFKKLIEYKKDHIAAGNIRQESNDNQQWININNQRWNQYICTTFGTFVILLGLALAVLFSYRILSYMLQNSNLNEHEKFIFWRIVVTILELCIPLYMYTRNEKLLKHFAYEILHIDLPTDFNSRVGSPKNIQNFKPKTSPIYGYMQNVVDPEALAPERVCKNDNIVDDLDQSLLEEHETIVAKPKTNPKIHRLSFTEQKNQLASERLKNAGFKMTENFIAEDGNCFIHSLKDQMR